ncbi:MAG: hypothetical protein ACPLZB_04675 [Caldisericaceae bacterium]
MTAKYAFVYSLGNRDITFSNESLSGGDTFLSRTKSFSEWLEKNKNYIRIDESGKIILHDIEVASLLIFPECLAQVKRKWDGFDHFDDLDYYVIVTSQDDKSQNDKDTIYLSNIINLYLKALDVPEVNLHKTILRCNPSLIDGVSDSLAQFLKQNKQFQTYLKIFVVSGPGTPAINISMINIFSTLENAALFYASGNLGKTVLKELNFNKQLIANSIIKSVLRLVKAYDYPQAKNLYESLDSKYYSRDVALILSALSYRTNFEFDKADNELGKIQSPSHEIAELKKHISKLRSLDKDCVLKELYYEFCVRMESKKFLEAIGMVFRFEEEMLKRVVEEVLGVSVTKKDNFAGYREKINSNTQLKSFLFENKIKLEEPSRIAYKYIVKFFVTQQQPSNIKGLPMNGIFNFAEEIDPSDSVKSNTLPQLRNNSPYGHGFEGVSEDKIEAIFPGGTKVLMKKFQEILISIGIPVEFPSETGFPFDRINSYIESALLKSI